MIPLPALGAIPWRLVGYGLAVVAVLALGWRVHAWREAYKAYPALEAKLAAEEACEAGSKCAERVAALQAAQAAISKTVVQGYEQELADLRNRPVERRVIRVCPDPGRRDVPGAGPAPGADAAGAAGGVVLGATEFDTAPLRDLARDADEVSARLRALQQWNAALATPPK